MTAGLVGTAPSLSGIGPLVEIIDTLLTEVQLAGSYGRPSPVYLRRRRFLGMLAQVAEEDLGLRFITNLPFLSTVAAMTEEGRPLAGYTLQQSSYLPSVWILDLWVRWRAAGQPADPHWEALDPAGSTDHPSPEEQRRRNDERVHQVNSLLRGAAWYCAHHEPDDAATPAVRYVVELAATGQAHVRAAAIAVALLLRAAAHAESASELVGQFTGGLRPVTSQQWARVGLTWPRAEQPTLSRAAQKAVSWLICYGQEKLEHARQAKDYGSWKIAMAAVKCAITCIIDGLPYANADLPIGLRAIISQFNEIYCDFPVLRFNSAAARYAGRPEIEGIVKWTRGIAGEYRGRLDDARLKRFSRERALVPPELLALDIPSLRPDAMTPLPVEWQHHSWRTITAACAEPSLLRIRPESRPYQPESVTTQEMKEDLSTPLQLILQKHESGDQTGSHQALADLLTRYPWHDVAYGLSIELHYAGRNVASAIEAAIAASVLRPEATHHWNWLALLLHAQGHERVAATATKIAQAAADFTTVMNRL